METGCSTCSQALYGERRDVPWGGPSTEGPWVHFSPSPDDKEKKKKKKVPSAKAVPMPPLPPVKPIPDRDLNPFPPEQPDFGLFPPQPWSNEYEFFD